MKHIILFIILCSSASISAQCPQNILLNGSMEGEIGTSIVVESWEGTSSPDINDDSGNLQTSAGYDWTGTPIASPDGGTWQNIFGPEVIFQTVELEQGLTYEVCTYYCAQGITAGSAQLTFVDPVGVIFRINGTEVHTTEEDTSGFSWEYDCFTFFAEKNSTTLQLGTTSTNYLALDGVCLQKYPPTSTEKSELDKSIKIFPNPITQNDFLYLELPKNTNAQVSIYNKLGQLVLSQNQTDAELNKISVDFEKGIYHVIIRLNNEVINRKLLVE